MVWIVWLNSTLAEVIADLRTGNSLGPAIDWD